MAFSHLIAIDCYASGAILDSAALAVNTVDKGGIMGSGGYTLCIQFGHFSWDFGSRVI